MCSEDVVEIGLEEEFKEICKEVGSNGNMVVNCFGVINDEDIGDEDGWK